MPIALLLCCTLLWVPHDDTLAIAVEALATGRATLTQRLYPIAVFAIFSNTFVEVSTATATIIHSLIRPLTHSHHMHTCT